jgi:flavin-dependent dehydrogenase
VDADADVLVLGGGPAGAATALALVARGLRVTVATKVRANAVRIGETVPPTIAQPLSELGVYDDFLADGHIAAPGTVVCWGDDQPYENDSIANPYGDGWHLDRDRFDATLLAAAVHAGAQVCRSTSFAAIERTGRGWHLNRTGALPLRAPRLVDATGRPARIATKFGAVRRREDRLIGLVRFGAAATGDHRTFIEACEHGWWYASVLPGGRAVTALMTDADLLPVGGLERQRLWDRAFSKTVLVQTVMTTATGQAPTLHAAPADVACLSVCAGSDWVAVGDAARTLDPLSGQGVTAACVSAVQAGEALIQPRRAPALSVFAAQTAAAHRAHVRTGLRYYRRETRWPRSPFWARRHQRFEMSS